jgi:uncharacterized protein involved in exopolysaccharide biosynthesis
MDQAQYLVSILQQQRNQALDAVADLAAQLGAVREQLAAAQAKIEALRPAETSDQPAI